MPFTGGGKNAIILRWGGLLSRFYISSLHPRQPRSSIFCDVCQGLGLSVTFHTLFDVTFLAAWQRYIMLFVGLLIFRACDGQ